MRKFIAGFEILGGIFVVLSLILILIFFHGQDISSEHVGFPIISIIWALLFAALHFFAGIYLWQDKKRGYILSIILQLIQLIRIQGPTFHYLFYSVVAVIINISKIGILTLIPFGAAYFISFAQQPTTTLFVGINLVALILLILLIVEYRKNTPKE